MDNKTNDTINCPRLIEVALPIREISAESVRDKNIHHAHISHLHIWWARRPLAASRAVVFASLVPDPDDPQCPEEFRNAVEYYLKTHVPTELRYYQRGREIIRDDDPYKPYEVSADPASKMGDTLRNRLLMFIAKWSPEAIEFEAGERKSMPSPKLLLDDRSLVKWEISDPDNEQGRIVLRIARELINAAHGDKNPTVLDPFAGGGAIPLEAGRLGCQPIANDYNPVAYLILRATTEFPQKYGNPGKRKVVKKDFGETKEVEEIVPNVLAHDVEKWAKWILERAKEKIGHLYPAGKNGRPVVGYLWARTAPCSNPSCKGEIPLVRSFLICNKKDKKIALTMEVDKANRHVHFGISKNENIRITDGTMQNRGNTLCPFCEQITPVEDLRNAGKAGLMGERIVAVIEQGHSGKTYRPVETADIEGFQLAKKFDVDIPQELILPEITTHGSEENISNSTGIRVHLYGMKTWGSIFNTRQLVVMQTFTNCYKEALKEIQEEFSNEDYMNALSIYLALLISKMSSFISSVCRWNSRTEIIQTPFSGQAIPMIWDYPEVNPLSGSTGSYESQLYNMLKVIKRNNKVNDDLSEPTKVILGNATSLDIKEESVDYVITDPPYYDAISYGDLSDFFYVWLKRIIGDYFTNIFTTPLTPKSEEVTSLKHRHKGSSLKAREHYRTLLESSFKEIKKKIRRNQPVTIMFAHQSTEAWTALISALLNSGLTPDATWPLSTEKSTGVMGLNTASLESSVTVICRPRSKGSAAQFKDVREEVQKIIHKSVQRFWSYGFRGADLIVACYGPAVGVFGKYESVEKGDGTPVEIPELLELVKRSALEAIAGEFRGDNLSTLYYVWANLYGTSEQSWDDARLVVQIGGDSDNAMEVARGHGIFVVEGSKCRLAILKDRGDRKRLGADRNPPLIDALHHSLLLWREEDRHELIKYLSERDLLEDGPLWKLAQALFEVLPRDVEDWKLISALIGECKTLRNEVKKTSYSDAQHELSFDKGGRSH